MTESYSITIYAYRTFEDATILTPDRKKVGVATTAEEFDNLTGPGNPYKEEYRFLAYWDEDGNRLYYPDACMHVGGNPYNDSC